jgi:hypothetical protein
MVMTTDEKLAIALKCIRSIAKYGGLLPSDELAKEALADMGEEPAPDGELTPESAEPDHCVACGSPHHTDCGQQ